MLDIGLSGLILKNAGYSDNTYDEEGNILTRGDDIFLETKAKYDLESLLIKQSVEDEPNTATEEKSLENFYKSYKGEKFTGLYWSIKENHKWKGINILLREIQFSQINIKNLNLAGCIIF